MKGWLSSFKKGSAKKWQPAEFWTWFASPEGQSVVRSAAQDPKAQEDLGNALKRVHPDLVWGMDVPGADGSPGTFEVSAGGLRELIPIVKMLVEAAPKIGGWAVVAFRQPSPSFKVQFGPDADEFDSRSILVAPKGHSNGKYDLDVYVPTPAGCPPSTTAEIGFIFLDHILGELTVMDRLAELHFYSTLLAPPNTMSLATFAAGLEFSIDD